MDTDALSFVTVGVLGLVAGVLGFGVEALGYETKQYPSAVIITYIHQ